MTLVLRQNYMLCNKLNCSFFNLPKEKEKHSLYSLNKCRRGFKNVELLLVFSTNKVIMIQLLDGITPPKEQDMFEREQLKQGIIIRRVFVLLKYHALIIFMNEL